MTRALRFLDLAGIGAGEGILVHKPSNVFYLSGFSGEGLLALTRKSRAVITDFRYTEQAEAQSPGWQVLMSTARLGHIGLAAALFKEEGVSRLYFEEDAVTVRAAREIREAMPGAELLPLKGEAEALRAVKDPGELALIRRACAISSEAFDYICGVIKPGLTEKEVQRALDFRLLETGAQAPAFATIVASGPNGSLPHAVPGDRKLQKGDLITLDYGARVGGYCSDMTRTVALGEPSALLRRVYGIVLDAQKASQDALGPGKACREVDAVARDRIAKEGYGENFGHGLGHSLGIDIHENPRLNAVSDDVLKPGHLMTVEPGIYLPGVGGVRIENPCLVTQQGAESLVSATRELVVL